MSVEARLQELGIILPPVPEAKGLYRPVVVVDRLAYTSGHLPTNEDGSILIGRVGVEFDVEMAAHAARRAGLAILASLRQAIGSLDRVERVIKVLGVIRCTPEFTQQPAVLNGCSQLFVDVFGPEAGLGARSALGTNALPLGVPVEIEAIFTLRDSGM